MPRTRTWIALGLLLVAPVLHAQNPANQAVPRAVAAPRRKAHKTQPQLVLPPMPRGPLAQLPMDQTPPAPAKVSFQDGLLTISAQNSTLGEILRDVRKLTGASIEIPQSSGANERVVAKLGPGAPRDVLAGLLNGSSFNYVMLGSSSDPMAVSSVMLTPKPSVAGETQTAVNTNPNVYQNNPGPVPPMRFPGPGAFNQNAVVQQPVNGQPASADADDKDDDSDADDKDDDQAQAQPGQPDAVDANVQVQPQPDPNAGPKTPEQIMEMLRRSQQPGGPGGQGAIPPTPPQQ